VHALAALSCLVGHAITFSQDDRSLTAEFYQRAVKFFRLNRPESCAPSELAHLKLCSKHRKQMSRNTSLGLEHAPLPSERRKPWKPKHEASYDYRFSTTDLNDASTFACDDLLTGLSVVREADVTFIKPICRVFQQILQRSPADASTWIRHPSIAEHVHFFSNQKVYPLSSDVVKQSSNLGNGCFITTPSGLLEILVMHLNRKGTLNPLLRGSSAVLSRSEVDSFFKSRVTTDFLQSDEPLPLLGLYRASFVLHDEQLFVYLSDVAEALEFDGSSISHLDRRIFDFRTSSFVANSNKHCRTVIPLNDLVSLAMTHLGTLVRSQLSEFVRNLFLECDQARRIHESLMRVSSVLNYIADEPLDRCVVPALKKVAQSWGALLRHRNAQAAQAINNKRLHEASDFAEELQNFHNGQYLDEVDEVAVAMAFALSSLLPSTLNLQMQRIHSARRNAAVVTLVDTMMTLAAPHKTFPRGVLIGGHCPFSHLRLILCIGVICRIVFHFSFVVLARLSGFAWNNLYLLFNIVTSENKSINTLVLTEMVKREGSIRILRVLRGLGLGVADDQLLSKFEACASEELQRVPELPLSATLVVSNDNGGHYSKKTARSSVDKKYEVHIRQQSFAYLKQMSDPTLQTRQLSSLKRDISTVTAQEVIPTRAPNLDVFRDGLAQNALLACITTGLMDEVAAAELTDPINASKFCPNPECKSLTLWPRRKRKCCADPTIIGAGCKTLLISYADAKEEFEKRGDRKEASVTHAQPVLMSTTNEDEDEDEPKPPLRKKSRKDQTSGVVAAKHDPQWYADKVLAYDSDGHFIGYYNAARHQVTADRQSIPLPMLHKTQSLDSLREWLDLTLKSVLTNGRSWCFVVGDGSTVMYLRKILDDSPQYQGKLVPVLGLMHEDKVNFETAFDLVLRLVGPSPTEALGWKTAKAISVLSSGADTRKLQDHVTWLTEGLFLERAREFLLSSPCGKTECHTAWGEIRAEFEQLQHARKQNELRKAGAVIFNTRGIPSVAAQQPRRDKLEQLPWFKQYRCLTQVRAASAAESHRYDVELCKIEDQVCARSLDSQKRSLCRSFLQSLIQNIPDVSCGYVQAVLRVNVCGFNLNVEKLMPPHCR